MQLTLQLTGFCWRFLHLGSSTFLAHVNFSCLHKFGHVGDRPEAHRVTRLTVDDLTICIQRVSDLRRNSTPNSTLNLCSPDVCQAANTVVLECMSVGSHQFPKRQLLTHRSISSEPGMTCRGTTVDHQVDDFT